MEAATASEQELKALFNNEREWLCSVKLDGIRCYVNENGPVSRTRKPIPNKYIHEMLSRECLIGFDGELIVGDNFQDTQSAVMSQDGEPDFTFHVFDAIYSMGEHLGDAYSKWVRRNVLLHRKARVEQLYPYVKILPQELFSSYDLFKLALDGSIDDGFEGMMLSDPTLPYKHGRSTLKQGYLIKAKPRVDAEGIITGFVEQVSINGEPKDTLGALEVTMINGKYKGAKLNVGTGFTDDERQNIWAIQDRFMGAIVTIMYQEIGSKNAPRQPAFKDLRKDL